MLSCLPCLCGLLVLSLSSYLYADNFRDDFNVVSYSNNNGNQAWSDSWVEIGEATSPTAGDIRVATASGVRIRNANRGIYREINLAASPYSSAILKYTYRRNSLDNVNDYVAVEVSNNGGSSWTRLKTYTGTGTDATPIADTLDISGYIAANTRIRFIGSPTLSANDQVYFDAIEIIATPDAAVTAPSLLAYYQADEFQWTGAAGEVTDSSGNGKNARALGGVNNLNTIPTGKICYAARVSNNTTDALQYTVDSGIDVDDDIGKSGHISFWYRPAPGTTWASGGNRTLFDASKGAPDNKIFFLTFISGGANNGKLRFAVRDANGGELRVRTTNAYVPAANEWVHIAVNWDLSNGAEIWLDGVKQTLVVETNTINNTAVLGELDSLYFGDNRSTYHPNGFANSARGDMDEIRIYRGNLTSTEINIDRDATHPCSAQPSSLLAYYKADEFKWTGSAGEIVDSSGNNKNATAVGGAANINTISTGKICYGGRVVNNTTDALQYAINSPLDVNNDIGAEGHINFWYRPARGTTWATGGNRTLFDASKGAPDNKVFFLTFISGGANNGKLRFAMRDANGGELRVVTATAYTPAANSWVHIAVNWSVGSGIEIWLDGVKQTLTVETNTINSSLLGELDSLYFGDNRSTYHGKPPLSRVISYPNSARGDLDEMRIYRGLRTEDEIKQDRDATHACVAEAGSLMAYYPMNESSWSGTTNVVLDKSGNNRNADVSGVIKINEGKPCKGIQIPRNTTNPLQYVVNTKIDLDDDIGSRGHISFWYRPASGTTWASGGNRTLFDASRGAPDNKIFFLSFISGGANNGKLRFAMRDASGGEWRVVTKNAYVPANNAWVNIAVNWDTAAGIEIYLDGVIQELVDERSTLAGNALGELDSLYIGDNRSTYHPNGFANSARGDMDELRIYRGIRTKDEIDVSMSELTSCYFLNVQVSATASTCVPSQVTIGVYDDAGFNTLSANYSGTINLSTSVNRGLWSTTTTAKGLLLPNPDTSDDGAVSYTFFVGDNSSTKLQLANQRAESLTITANAAGAFSYTSPSINYSDNAFVITEDPVQVAGKPQSMQAKLWQRDTTQSPANCAVATAYTGNKLLKSWITRDVADPSGIAPTISGTALPSVLPAANNLPLSFSAGVASFVLDTSDVGKYALNLQDDSRAFATNTDIVGASSVLIVRPFGFYLNAGANSSATSASGTAFKKAGENFDLSIKAVAWQSVDDANSDGIPDANVDLSNNAATPAFNNQTVTLPHTLVLPSPGKTGIFSPSALNSFTAGSATVAANFSEVGIINIDANLDSYLGGAGVTGKLNNIGRFIPDHFTLMPDALTNRTAMMCSPASSFTYIGENLHQTFKLTAENLAGVKTENYVGAFARLDTNDELDLQFAHDGTADLTGLRTFAMSSPLSWASAESTIDVDMALNRPANDATGLRGSYSAVAVAVNPVDEDGVTIAGVKNLDVTRDGINDHWQASTGTTSLLYGRFELLPAYGSETRNLAMPLRVMSYTANGWQINALDNCTAYGSGSGLGASLSSFTDNLGSGETTPQFPSTAEILDKGQNLPPAPQFFLVAPGAGNFGSVQVDLTGVADYLWYPWTHCATGVQCAPRARASFGLYRGNDRVIYWRAR